MSSTAAQRRGGREQLNFAFHRTIHRLARAAKISWLLGATLRYVPREFFAAVPGWPEASAHDHHAVLTALRNRDSEAARAAMSRHVTGAGALLAEHLARLNPHRHFWNVRSRRWACTLFVAVEPDRSGTCRSLVVEAD